MIHSDLGHHLTSCKVTQKNKKEETFKRRAETPDHPISSKLAFPTPHASSFSKSEVNQSARLF